MSTELPNSANTQLALYDYLIPTLGGVIILLNLFVVISSGLIMKKGQQPRATYLFLGNVAMTDLMTGVAVEFGQLYPKQNRNHYTCALQLGMIVSSTLTSVYSVGLIGIDRFLYIVHGMRYQQWVYPMRARLCILATWIIGCVVGFLPLMGWSGDTDNGRICWFTFLAPKNLILLTVLVGIIPLVTVVVLYSIILYHALKKTMQLQKTGDTRHKLRFFRGRRTSPITSAPPAPKPPLLARIFRRKEAESSAVEGPSKWKAVKVVMFTSGSFCVTWAPYFITCIVYVYECEVVVATTRKKCKNLEVVIASPLAILGFTNSLINPIIYAWWHKGFRTFVKKRVSGVVRTRWQKWSVSSARNAQGGSGQERRETAETGGAHILHI